MIPSAVDVGEEEEEEASMQASKQGSHAVFCPYLLAYYSFLFSAAWTDHFSVDF